MVQGVPNTVDASQIAMAKKMLSLENQIKGGIGWFFWIAGLSVVNTIIFLTGGRMTFSIGLGVTQFIDGFSMALARDIGTNGAPVVQAIALFLDFVIAGIFVLFGVLGRKRIKWAIIVGLILYTGDGLLSLLFQAWLGAAFHALALWGLFSGLRAINELARIEKSLSPGDIAVPVLR